jgi:hypothetical protein
MKGKSLLGKLSFIALLAIASQSCKKIDGIDNNNVIQKPYVVFAADASGNIFKTNNGNNYTTIFPGDGSTLRAVITSKENILVVKGQTLFLSVNEGKSFNPYNNLTVPASIKWPYFIMDVPSFARIYSVNILSGPKCGTLSFSQWDNGKSFDADTNWKDDTPYTTESLTQLDNGTLYGYSLSGSANGISKLFYKTGKDDPFMPRATDLTSPYNFYLSHSNNTLIATDYDGVKGSWYSNDDGKTFSQYAGLPAGKKLYATYGKYNQVLIGTQDNGVYLLQGSTFYPSNNGLDPLTSVYGIVSKENLYKNNVVKKFFYLATSTGIYRSEDLAKSWVKVKDGDYRIIN